MSQPGSGQDPRGRGNHTAKEEAENHNFDETCLETTGAEQRGRQRGGKRARGPSG